MRQTYWLLLRLTGPDVTVSLVEDANATSLATNEMICARVACGATERSATGWGHDTWDEWVIGVAGAANNAHLISGSSVGAVLPRFPGLQTIAVEPLTQRHTNRIARIVAVRISNRGEVKRWCAF